MLRAGRTKIGLRKVGRPFSQSMPFHTAQAPVGQQLVGTNAGKSGTRLEEENRKQHRKIVELERRVQEQEAQILSMGHSKAAEGVSCSMHLSQAVTHLGQAFGAATSYATDCCCGSCGRPSASTHALLKEEETTGGPSSEQEQSRGGRNSSVPDWDSAMEKKLKKKLLRAESPAPPPVMSADTNVLEGHEYVLEDEWATSRTTVFNPRAQWKETWDMFVLVSILYSAIVIPVRICFSAEAEGRMWDFEVAMSIFFIIDCAFNFNTSYPVEDKWVISRRRIVLKYLQGVCPRPRACAAVDGGSAR